MKVFKTILLVACLVSSQTILAQASPVPMLEKSANDIIATLKENKSSLKTNPSIIYSAVETHLLPNVDVAGMSRSVLGRQAWNKATPQERDQFSRAFTRLVIRTYASPLAQYSDETIQFLPLRGSLNSRFMRVNSVIVRSEGQNIPLSDVTHCDSAGLALLIEARKLCKHSNKMFEVIGVSPETQSLAEFCGVKSILETA